MNRIIETLLKCKIMYLTKKCFFYRPTMVVIDKTAIINIRKHFFYNKNHDSKRILKNKFVGSFFLGKKSVFEVGLFTCGPGCNISVNANSQLSLGSGYMLSNCTLDCFNKITIGENVVISKNVTIRDSNNHMIKDNPNYQITAPIIIEDNVWIGMNCTILPGVKIGTGSVVAAGSVVNKSVPPHCLVAGVPAHIVRENVEWGD